MSLAEESRRVVLQWIECLNEARFDDLFALGAPDATWWLSGQKEMCEFCGTYPYAEREPQLKSMIQDSKFKITVKGITTEGDTVVVEGAPRGEAKNGRIYVNDLVFKFVVKDGKIQSLKEYADLVPILKFMAPEA